MSSADDEKKKLDKIIDAEKSSLTKTLDNLEIQITVADQNGLFVNKRKDFEDIVDKVNCARRELEKKGSDLSSCSKALYQVIDDLENLERAKPLNWRLSNRYGLQIWLYLIAFLSLVFLFYYFNIDGSLVTIFGIQQQGIDAAAWGVVGGILRGLWWLWHNINRDRLRRIWKPWFISSPFLGGILGVLVYFALAAGLVVVAGNDQIQTLNPYVVIALAALAGYRWEWAVERLDQLRNSVQSSNGGKPK